MSPLQAAFPLKVIFDGLSFYNTGFTLEESCRLLKAQCGLEVKASTLAGWVHHTVHVCPRVVYSSMKLMEIIPLALTRRWRVGKRGLTPFAFWLSVAIGLMGGFTTSAQAVVLDSFVEDFEGRTADATIHDAEFWKVTAGSTLDALVQSSVTPRGSGKALKLAGASTPVSVARSTTYGGMSPTWVRMLIRPGVGSEQRAAPTSGIAAVTFDASGKILSADGTRWVDTGLTFTTDAWWEVIYKLNFTSRTYDLYATPLNTSGTTFTPVKTGLNFIDSSNTALHSIQFQGAYSPSQPDDAYVDDLTITYIERIAFVSPAQTLVQDQPSGPIMVQLQSNLRDPQRAVEDILLEFKSTSPGGRFSLEREPWRDITQRLLVKDTTSVTVYYKDSRVGQPILSVKEFPDRGWLEGLQQQKVLSKVAHFEVLASSPQTAGAAFPVTIEARNAEGAVDETYAGTVALRAIYVSPASGTKPLVPTQASGFQKGRVELSAAYSDAGAILITVADTSDETKTGSSGQLLVVPARLVLEAEARQIVNQPFGLTVKALGADGSLTPNYQGPVTLGLQAVTPMTTKSLLSPPTIGAASFQGGAALIEARYPSWGTILVTAADTAFPTVVGRSTPLTFHPKEVRLTVVPPPAPRDFFYTQESFKVDVSGVDAEGKPIPDYLGTVALSASSALGVPETYTFTADDHGVHQFSASAAAPGAYQLQAQESAAGLVSATASVTVKQALLKVVSGVAPVGSTAAVTILLVDDQGKVIESESTATITVKLVEENPNESVSASALTQVATFSQGKATVLLSDTEEETVTLTPSSPLGLKAQSGTVRFGRFATKGVGILLWHEIRESTP